ncbi:hypothetical protein AB0H20_31525 [Nocardia fluminea]|uniref:hypothetical protein n=1 Tax=Nocardia fluminea TaxID=134984 RepID=UPI0033E7841B
MGFGVVGGVERGDDRQYGGLLGVEIAVGATHSLGEGVVGVTLLGLPQDRVLLPLNNEILDGGRGGIRCRRDAHAGCEVGERPAGQMPSGTRDALIRPPFPEGGP